MERKPSFQWNFEIVWFIDSFLMRLRFQLSKYGKLLLQPTIGGGEGYVHLVLFTNASGLILFQLMKVLAFLNSIK